MADMLTVLHRWDDVPSERISDSLTRRLVTGERMMIAHLRLEEGALVPMHSHENEQLSWVLEGALRFVVGKAPEDGEADREVEGGRQIEAGQDVERGRDTEAGQDVEGGREIVVRAGEVLHLPSQVPHSAEALEDTVAVDVFSPPRQDWLGTDE